MHSFNARLVAPNFSMTRGTGWTEMLGELEHSIAQGSYTQAVFDANTHERFGKHGSKACVSIRVDQWGLRPSKVGLMLPLHTQGRTCSGSV